MPKTVGNAEKEHPMFGRDERAWRAHPSRDACHLELD